ncbi:MAG: DegT/DnrJ/EryC1/StrS aminotransferase family protein [Desulfobacteraceae bacterium]|nr:MAG: DegT/DnrJ/EryC1/StrS aminotransferase family protein [Desulfobacteraceae bacterium]
MEIIPHSRPSIDQEEIAAVVSVLQSGRIAQGEQVLSFEKALASMIGVAGAVAVNSGTAALHLALLALGIGENDEVVIPSFVCPALLNSIRYVRAVPVPADINPETFNMDVPDIRKRLTGKTKAIIIPHIFGLPADIREIVSLGVPVVEDCAQSLGSSYDGLPTGSFGALSVFSFYATKVICTGEGGMIASGDSQLLQKIRDLRDYDEKDDSRLRYNYKLTDLQAAMGLTQLRKLPVLIGRRRAIAGRYNEFFREHLLPVPVSPSDREHIYYRYIIRTRHLSKLLDAGRDAGIAYRRPVFKPLHHYLGMTGYPKTDEAFLGTVSIPIYPSLRDTEVKTVLNHLQSILK